MKIVKLTALLAAVAFILYIVVTWDGTAPRIDWSETPETIGASGRITLNIEDSGKGLREIEVAAIQGGQRHPLLNETYSGSGWPWEGRTPKRTVAVILQTAEMPALKEGPFEVEVTAIDQPNLWWFTRTAHESRSLTLDLTPPRLSVLSSQHYLRQGGSELISYRVDGGAARSGALIGDHEFRGYRVASAPDGTFAVLVGLAYDQAPDSRLALWAEDSAGNRAEISFPGKILPDRFRRRQITISDAFIDSVAPEILQHSPQIQAKESKLDTYLAINGELRRINHEFIEQLSRESADHFLWSEPFLQLSNSQVEASFADFRTYLYDGKPVDQQIHLGFDLASTAQSPVEASNDGQVLWADYLGIYGNCVILDHGMGLMSLYGHLSAIDVQKGDAVKRGQKLGLTGQTGLAGGDHLHFSTFVQGTPVNPLEWWDPKWIQNHIFNRLAGTPTSAGVTPASNP